MAFLGCFGHIEIKKFARVKIIVAQAKKNCYFISITLEVSVAEYTWIKARTMAVGKRLKDVAVDLGYPYGKFIRIINEFQKAPDGFDEEVEAVLKKWDPDGNFTENS